MTRLAAAHIAIEIGTQAGYSALYIVRGLVPDGCLITFEVNEASARLAWRRFEREC